MKKTHLLLDDSLPLTIDGEPYVEERTVIVAQYAFLRASVEAPASELPPSFMACHPETWQAMSEAEKAHFTLIQP